MKAKGFSHESAAALSVEWYTPPWIFQALGINFDLDPCHPGDRLPWVPVSLIYSLPLNGLLMPWSGKVWCNPPYGSETINWLAKMSAHGNGVALVFARTDCAWFHEHVTTADAVLFLKGRVRFVDGAGVSGGGGAGSGSMLIAWGAENVKALEGMSSYGFLIKHGKEYIKNEK